MLINRKPLIFLFSLILFSYDFSHTFYYIYKFINFDKIYLALLIIFSVAFILHLIETLLTTLIDPGSFLPNTKEDHSDSSDINLMIATIKKEEFF
jgi:ABC-type enterochelin transport system permease subunit